MTLLEEVLQGTLTQQLTATKDVSIVAIRPKLLRANSPAGTLKLQVLDENGKLKNESNSVTISGIGTGNFFHGYVRFDVNSPIKSGEIFQVRLASTGYTFSDAAYISWLLDFDLRKYTATYTPNTGRDAPYDLEVWDKREIGMVRELDFSDGFTSSAQPDGGIESTLANNQVAPADVTGLSFSTLDTESVTIGYTVYRTDGAADKRRSGTMKLQHKPVVNTVQLEDESEHDTQAVTGITFSKDLTGTTMKIQYTSTDFTGQTKGFVMWNILERYTPGA